MDIPPAIRCILQEIESEHKLPSCVFSCICTSVVDVSRDLYVTLLRVDRKLIEVFVFLQRKFSSQRQRVPVLIHLVDQQGVVVVKLERTVHDEHTDFATMTLRKCLKKGSLQNAAKNKKRARILRHLVTYLHCFIVVVVKVSILCCFCQPL